MKNKGIYTEDDRIIIVDDKGYSQIYESSEDVIELNQSLNDLDYIEKIKKNYKENIDDLKLAKKILIAITSILLLGYIPLNIELITSSSTILNMLGVFASSFVLFGVPFGVHIANKKIKNLQRKYDYIETEELNINNKIEDISKKVKTKDFEDKKNQKIIEFKKVSEEVKDRLDYVLENTNYNEKTKVYTLKPNKSNK